MEEFGEIFNIMSSNQLNKMCFDCKKPYPLFASINNGIFICETCAELHRHMGSHISYVKNLKEKWDEYLLSYMRRGGNNKLAKVVEDYDINEGDDKFHKYRKKAIENYRLILRSEILAEEPPEKCPIEQGNMISDKLEFNPYPEFDNYVLMEEAEFNTNPSVMTKVGSFIKKLSKSVSNAANRVSERIKQMELGDRIKVFGSKSYVVMQTAGGFVILKSKPVVNKLKEKTIEGLGIISDKTKTGANIIAKKTKEFYTDIKSYAVNSKVSGECSVPKESKINKNQNIINENGNSEIINYINEHEVNMLEKNNSFTLLNGNNYIEENISFPTLDELEREDNLEKNASYYK